MSVFTNIYILGLTCAIQQRLCLNLARLNLYQQTCLILSLPVVNMTTSMQIKLMAVMTAAELGYSTVIA